MSDLAMIKAQVALSKKKSAGMGFLLTLLFGPLGTLYGSMIIGVLLIIINIVVAIPTFGFGLIIMWPINLIATWVLIKSHNGKIDRSVLKSA